MKETQTHQAMHCERLDYEIFLHSEDYSPRKRLYLQANVLPALRSLAPHDPILEIGPGHGELLGLLRDTGFSDIEAFEVCPSLAEKCRSASFVIHEGQCAAQFLETNSAKLWKAIILVDVVEHLDLLTASRLLRAARERLLPSGILIVQIPNASGIYGSNTFAGDPTHKLFLNEHGLSKLFLASGWKNVRISGVRLPSTPLDRLRETIRPLLFIAHQLTMRAVGASPVRILTSNLFAVAAKESA